MLLLVTLAGCATTTGSVSTTEYGICDDPRTEAKWDGLLQPTYWRSSWPDDAIEQAKERNAVGLRVCGEQWGK